MPVIKIIFPGMSVEASTFVDDAEWNPMTINERDELIREYVKDQYPSQYRATKRWSEQGKTKRDLQWKAI